MLVKLFRRKNKINEDILCMEKTCLKINEDIIRYFIKDIILIIIINFILL